MEMIKPEEMTEMVNVGWIKCYRKGNAGDYSPPPIHSDDQGYFRLRIAEISPADQRLVSKLVASKISQQAIVIDPTHCIVPLDVKLVSFATDEEHHYVKMDDIVSWEWRAPEAPLRTLGDAQ